MSVAVPQELRIWDQGGDPIWQYTDPPNASALARFTRRSTFDRDKPLSDRFGSVFP
jgi:hypothetical protein